MRLPIHSPVQKKISLGNDNSNNNESSGIKIVDEQTTKSSNGKNYHNKEKEKKNAILKKINNDIEIVQETKIVKVKNLMDDDFINEYDPKIQDNNINPKLKFFIDIESVSESDKDFQKIQADDKARANEDEEIMKMIRDMIKNGDF